MQIDKMWDMYKRPRGTIAKPHDELGKRAKKSFWKKFCRYRRKAAENGRKAAYELGLCAVCVGMCLEDLGGCLREYERMYDVRVLACVDLWAVSGGGMACI